MRTFNNIVDQIKYFQEQHPQIHSFGFGDITLVGKSEIQLYPCLWVHPTNTILKRYEDEINFNILLMDKCNDGKTNTQEILSDTKLIARDLKTFLNEGSFDEITVEDDLNLAPFEERFGDMVAGWNLNLKCLVEAEENLCSIPGFSTSFSGSNNHISYSSPYLTCDTLTACTQFQNYIAAHGGAGNLQFFAQTNPGGSLQSFTLQVQQDGNNVTYILDYFPI
jgi:hypothetical protein